MRRGESSLCGALMTHKVPHKVPHKLPHKTDVGFLEPIPHGGGVHENARIFGVSFIKCKNARRRPLPALAGGVLVSFPKSQTKGL